MAHKGQRTNKHREAEFPHAVDIPVGKSGLGQNLNRIHAAVDACPGKTDIWPHTTRKPNGDPLYWCRVGTMTPTDADMIAVTFAALGARRVR